MMEHFFDIFVFQLFSTLVKFGRELLISATFHYEMFNPCTTMRVNYHLLICRFIKLKVIQNKVFRCTYCTHCLKGCTINCKKANIGFGCRTADVED